MNTLGHLIYLDVKKNAIKTLDGLDIMQNLKYLDVSENKLNSLVGCSVFTNLETLVASKNLIKAISNLNTLSKLSFVDLRQNCLQNLDGLPQRLGPNISTLYLDSNPLVDFVNLLYLRPFAALENLSIVDTPFAKKMAKKE